MNNYSRDKLKFIYFRYIDSSPSRCSSLSLYLKHSPYLISDIDKCSKNSHNCSYSTASCTNTNGSFKCICKPGFSGDGHNCTGTEHYLEHDNLSFHHNKTYATGRSRVIVYTNLLLLKTWWSYSGALSPLFPISLGVRNHDHEHGVLIPIPTSMNVPTIPTTAAGTMPLVQTPRGRSTVLVMLDLLEMDTSAKVKSYALHLTPPSLCDVCITADVWSLCKYRVSRLFVHTIGFISGIGGDAENTSNNSNENAICENSGGSSKCMCKPGFSGDGHNCTGNKFSSGHISH